jgi:hypothetical protein
VSCVRAAECGGDARSREIKPARHRMQQFLQSEEFLAGKLSSYSCLSMTSRFDLLAKRNTRKYTSKRESSLVVLFMFAQAAGVCMDYLINGI